MRRMPRLVLLVGLVALTPLLSACADFDMDKLDVFGLNEKKKLPGERKDLFPQGVPGVSQGIPPEYIKGNQPQPETASALPVEPEKPATEGKPAKKTAAVQPADEAKPKPKAKRKPKPAQTAQPAAQQQPPQQVQSPNQGLAPWPTAPAPGTFSR